MVNSFTLCCLIQYFKSGSTKIQEVVPASPGKTC
uniref:Uncharacterized protein n=1 Tax=Anguilla anguilla TaxID=7936 RepID=A0A0E9W726_ANGAN